MAFTSLNFLIFAAICVAVYYAVPQSWKWCVLLVASYAFYLLSSPKTFVFILLTTAVTYLGGRYIGRCNVQHKAYLDEHKAELSRDEKKELKAESQKRKRKMVALILILDFGVLAVLKYFRGYLAAAGIFDTGQLLIPLGIFAQNVQVQGVVKDQTGEPVIGATVMQQGTTNGTITDFDGNLYRNKIDPDTNVAKFALFTAFFPQLVQGPISRHDQLAHQLYEGHKFAFSNLTFGAQLILWGFFKKLVIADRVDVLCDQVFDNYTDYTGGAIFVAMLFYMIQIYADFSGGIDIARGVAQCMGIDMTHNFRRPYFAGDLSDFWNRWHISLSHWCRDYIFYPVAMSKFFGKAGKSLRNVFGDRIGKLFPVIIAQYCTFLMIGLWHGAQFKYIAFGLYNGTVIVLGLLFEPLLKGLIEKLHINVSSKAWQGFRIVRTFVIVFFGRVLPRAVSFGAAVAMVGSMFHPNHGVPFGETVMSLGLTGVDFLIVVGCCIIWFLVSLWEERDARINGGDGSMAFRNKLEEMPLAARWAILLAGFAMVLMSGIYGPGYDASAFIYRGF